MEMLALPVERAVVRGHRLEDEIVCFPEPVHDAHRVLVGGSELVRHALDKAHVEPPAGDDVDIGELLRDAQWIGPVPDRVTEHKQPRALGLPRQYRERDDDG